MRLALPACLALIAAAPVAAETASGGQPCMDRDMVLAFFKHERGLTLHSWGLDDDGRNLEPMIAPDGRFAVIVQSPNGCAYAITPNQHWSRLSDPQFSEKPVPDAVPCPPGLPPSACRGPRRMHTGERL